MTYTLPVGFMMVEAPNKKILCDGCDYDGRKSDSCYQIPCLAGEEGSLTHRILVPIKPNERVEK